MIKIYTATWCGPCHSAKSLLKELNLEYDEINIEEENISREMLYKLSGNYTVPQIFINDQFIRTPMQNAINLPSHKMAKLMSKVLKKNSYRNIK